MADLRLEEEIKRSLKKYRDIPFVHNGRSLEGGLDCLGFIIVFYKEFGIEIPSDDGQFIEEDWYKKDPERYIRNIKALPGTPISVHELMPLDLVYFSISRGIITHTGVMINHHEFAHMSPKSNFLVSKLERHWLMRFRGAVRLKR